MCKKLSKLIVCNVCLVFYLCNCVLSNKVYYDSKDIVKEKVIPLVENWAPKVWLDPQEKFFPSNVSSFLKEITPMKKNGQKYVNGNMTKIPTGGHSNEFYFITNKNRDALLKDPYSFLHGVKPSKQNVSIYAHVKTCDPDYNNFIITYWFFYPFNEGKEMCTVFRKNPLPIFKVFNKCLGKTRVFGNHIADWERVSLEIKNGSPTSLFLSVHNAGVIYSYDRAANSFVLSRAKSKGLGEPQDPPETVRVDRLGHPILFSAKGSHALWAGVGTHKYTKLNLRELSDAADFGTPWDTWNSVEVFYSDETTPDWYHFQGHWGNPGSNCLTKGICEFGDGPGGLAGRQLDFDCTRKLQL